MKKLIFPFLLSSALFFACENTNNNHDAGHGDSDQTNSHENVEQNSGDQVSPQLEQNADSPSRLEVDTISSANEANEQKK